MNGVDWTVLDGRSNSSPEFLELRRAVEQLIRAASYDLIAGRTDTVAGVIVAQLAHRYGVGPRRELEAVVREGVELMKSGYHSQQSRDWLDKAAGLLGLPDA